MRFASSSFQSSPPESQHHDPMVAMVCPSKQGDPVDRLFHNQYLSSSGKWATDFDHKATCTTDKVEILEYCKKVSELLLRSSPSSRGLEEKAWPPRKRRPHLTKSQV